MDSDYKLHVRLGSAEFNGEGPETAVKEAYQQFLEALSKTPNTPSVAIDWGNANPPPWVQPQPPLQKPAGVSDDLLARAYIRDGDTISLRHLPPSDRPSRNADAAILILYGFKKLAAQEDVLVTRLNEALRRSGITMERVDRFITTHAQLYRKGGQRSGGRYSLNNQGELQAEAWLKEWFS